MEDRMVVIFSAKEEDEEGKEIEDIMDSTFIKREDIGEEEWKEATCFEM